MKAITQGQLIEQYDELLNEAGPVTLLGVEYDVSTVLQAVDEILYREGLHDYASSLVEDGYLVEGY